MPLRSRTRTLAASSGLPTYSASARTARSARLSSPEGTDFAPSPETSTPDEPVSATMTSSVNDSAWNTVVSSW